MPRCLIHCYVTRQGAAALDYRMSDEREAQHARLERRHAENLRDSPLLHSNANEFSLHLHNLVRLVTHTHSTCAISLSVNTFKHPIQQSHRRAHT